VYQGLAAAVAPRREGHRKATSPSTGHPCRELSWGPFWYQLARAASWRFSACSLRHSNTFTEWNVEHDPMLAVGGQLALPLEGPRQRPPAPGYSQGASARSNLRQQPAAVGHPIIQTYGMLAVAGVAMLSKIPKAQLRMFAQRFTRLCTGSVQAYLSVSPWVRIQ
jgi:hypothetical protein